RIRPAVPIQYFMSKFFIPSSQRFMLTGRCHKFPLVERWQPLTLPFSISASCKPRYIGYRTILDLIRIRAEIQIAAPVIEVVFLGKDRLNLGTAPFRILSNKLKELRISYRRSVQQERCYCYAIV